MKPENTISKTWETKRRFMNPKRMLLFFTVCMIYLLMIMIFVMAVNFVRRDQAQGATLPDSLQTEVLKLEAAGKFPAADSLKRVFQAKTQLTQRQKAAQDSLAKRQLTAQKKLWAIWNQQVTPMSIDSVWVWAGKDAGKIAWLAGRYNFRLDPKVPTEAQLPTMKAEIEARKKLRLEVSRQIALQVGRMKGQSEDLQRIQARVDSLEKTVVANSRDLRVLHDAVTDNSFDIKAALSVLERVNLAVEPNQGNKALIEAARVKARQQ